MRGLGLSVALVLVAACTSAPLTYGVPTPAGATIGTAAAAVTFTNENWALAVADAGRYKGSPVTLIGRIFLDPERTEGQLAFQMYADPVGNSQNTIVAGLPPTTELKRNDYVRVVGVIHDTVTGMNLMGGVLQVPRIRATSAVKITRAEAVAPTLREVAVQKAAKQHAIAITLQKVEFAKTETRFFVKIENDGPAKASVHAFNAVVVQGTKQAKPKSSLFDAEYAEIPSPMFAGVIAETVLLFDALELAPLRFVWSASSDNYSQRFTDYVWEVTAAAAERTTAVAVSQTTSAPAPVPVATTPRLATVAATPTPAPTPTPALAATPTPTVRATAPPTPTPTVRPTPAPTPQPTPIRLSGRGQVATSPVRPPTAQNAVTFSHRGTSNFAVWLYRGERRDLLVNTIGNYDGARVILGTEEVTFSIEADGAWTATIAPIVPGGSVAMSGIGDTVGSTFAPPGTTALRFAHSGTGNFAVWLYCADARQLLQNTIGVFSGSKIVQFGQAPCFWAVDANGAWSIARQ